jgi:hypothetical protein
MNKDVEMLELMKLLRNNVGWFKIVGILFGVVQKVETHFLGTLKKSILESCQESSML